jgi:PAS domain S-box-containing protein
MPVAPEELETLVAMSPAPMVVADANGELVAGCATLGDLIGWDVPSGSALTSLFPTLTWETIETNCEEDPGEYVTVRATGESGDDTWVDLGFKRHRRGGDAFIVGVVHDVTARQEREQRCEQYERILETIEDGIYTLDESFTIETVNGAVESMTGYDEADLIGANATLLADDAVIDQAARLSEELLSGDRKFATLTTELETADGGALPIETRFSMYQLDNDRYRHVGVVRDISDRRQFERTLAALHDSTRELFEAQTTLEVGQLVADAAADVGDVIGAAFYRFDSNETLLVPAAAAGDIADCPDDCRVFGPQSDHLWKAFIKDTPVTVEDGEVRISDEMTTGGVCLPLGEYGVLYAAIEGDGRGPENTEVLDLLAASAEVALARVNREQRLRERDEELRRQNAQLKQLEEINAIVRNVDRILVDADTREEIEDAVCDRLASSRWFSLAWVGRVGGAELTPSAWAGESSSYLDAVSFPLAGEGGPPAVRTARSEEMTVVTSIADDIRSEQWRTEAVSADLQSAMSVPLRHDDIMYGVLTVYGTADITFDGMFQSVLAELGEIIANAIREVESRQRRSTTSVMELDVSLSAPTSPLGRLADTIGSPIVCDGVVPEADGTTQVFFGVDGAETASSVCKCDTDLTRITSLTAIADEGGDALFEAVVTGATVAGPLLDQGSHVRSLRVEPDGETIVATIGLSTGVDVRTFVERLEESYDGAHLVARRELTAPGPTERGIQSALESHLTDRQSQVLRTAYLSGYFDWPRKSTGGELADRLDISQPTMSRHLRIAERRLLELVFGDR